MSNNPAYLPPSVLIADYLKVINRIGIERAVIVHANVYGLDNSLALDVIASARNCPLLTKEMTVGIDGITN